MTKTIARYGRVGLLCIDEIGDMGLDRRGAEPLFQVLTEGGEKNSAASASNESFGGWTRTFTDPRLCAAVVDRLTFGGNISETGTEPYRLAGTRAAQAQNTSTDWPRSTSSSSWSRRWLSTALQKAGKPSVAELMGTAVVSAEPP
ncbi:hypothetical protein SUDANB176_07301 [Streptomyces sp. enrichment culture]